MARLAILGFTATISLLLPATWRATEAELPTDGPMLKPPLESFKIGDTEVKVDVDRAAVAPGGTVTLTLVATSDTPHRVPLVLREMGSESEPGERVEPTPITLARQEVTVDAAPGGGKPRTVTFKLPASKAHRGTVSDYTILVQPAKAAKKIRTAEDLYTQTVAELPEDAPEGAEAPAIAAMVVVATHEPEAYSVTIEPPAEKPADGQPFEVAVRVKNPSKRTLHDVYLELSPSASVLGSLGMGSRMVMDADEGGDDWKIEPVDPNADITALAPGEEKVVRYRVTPPAGATGGALFASAYSNDAGNALDWKDLGAPTQVAAK
jgi:hypothetical protein